MTKAVNPCAKTVKPEQAYEVWQVEDHPTYRGRWAWFVLKKYQAPEREAKNSYARWHCFVISPYVLERGAYGDTYVSDITGTGATRLIHNPQAQPMQFHVHGEKPASDNKVECLDLWFDRLPQAQVTYRDLCATHPFVELLIEQSQEGEEEGIRVTLLTHGIRPELTVQDVQSSEEGGANEPTGL